MLLDCFTPTYNPPFSHPPPWVPFCFFHVILGYNIVNIVKFQEIILLSSKWGWQAADCGEEVWNESDICSLESTKHIDSEQGNICQKNRRWKEGKIRCQWGNTEPKSTLDFSLKKEQDIFPHTRLSRYFRLEMKCGNFIFSFPSNGPLHYYQVWGVRNRQGRV